MLAADEMAVLEHGVSLLENGSGIYSMRWHARGAAPAELRAGNAARTMGKRCSRGRDRGASTHSLLGQRADRGGGCARPAGISARKFQAGSYICHRGDRLDAWTGVVTGLVKISAISRDGKAMTFAGVGAGGWFGEGTVIKNEARKYDLVALRDTELALMNRATFMWLFDTSVGFNQFLVHQLNERMGQFIATIEHDRIHDPIARVARNLAWLFNPVLYPDVGTPHRDHAGGAGPAGRGVAAGRQPGAATAGRGGAACAWNAAASRLSMSAALAGYGG